MEPWEIIIILFGSGSILGIVIQYQIQKLHLIQEKLREERRKVYSELLLPFIDIFANPRDPQIAIERISSPAYRQTAFDLTLVGSDDVVKAYGNLMQHIYKNNNNSNDEKNSSEIIRLWAVLLLEIRKSLGNKFTKLNEKDMLRHLITDIEKVDFKQ